MSEIIHSEQLVKKFRRVEALNGLDLKVPEGAMFALVGPNGAGKTTAIKILMNIFQPTSGYASVLGIDSRKLRGSAFASIGYVSENQQLPGWMRVGKFIEYLRGFYPTWDKELEAKLIKQFDLPVDRKLKHLSRGMRMKAALAGSLAFRPKIVILDEPFSGLDPLVRDELSEALIERARESTVLLSSHDLAEVESFASHVGYLESGRLKFSEEMATLSARFREVEVAMHSPPVMPDNWPEAWLQVNARDSTVHFVDSAFDLEGTTAEIEKLFGVAHNTTFAPMSLRAIFLALAKGRQRAS